MQKSLQISPPEIIVFPDTVAFLLVISQHSSGWGSIEHHSRRFQKVPRHSQNFLIEDTPCHIQASGCFRIKRTLLTFLTKLGMGSAGSSTPPSPPWSIGILQNSIVTRGFEIFCVELKQFPL